MPFTFNDFHNTSIMSSAVSASSQNSYQQYPQRNISSVVSNYDRMHRALDKHTKYYRLSPAQFIFLRRGSKWMPMLVKIFINLICLFIAIQMPADSDFDKDDRGFYHILLRNNNVVNFDQFQVYQFQGWFYKYLTDLHFFF